MLVLSLGEFLIVLHLEQFSYFKLILRYFILDNIWFVFMLFLDILDIFVCFYIV